MTFEEQFPTLMKTYEFGPGKFSEREIEESCLDKVTWVNILQQEINEKQKTQLELLNFKQRVKEAINKCLPEHKNILCSGSCPICNFKEELGL